jgi:hypothetical protein
MNVPFYLFNQKNFVPFLFGGPRDIVQSFALEDKQFKGVSRFQGFQGDLRFDKGHGAMFFCDIQLGVLHLNKERLPSLLQFKECGDPMTLFISGI